MQSTHGSGKLGEGNRQIKKTNLYVMLKRQNRKVTIKINCLLHVSLRWDVGNGGSEELPGACGGCVDSSSRKYSHAHRSTTCRGRSACLHSQTNERFHVLCDDSPVMPWTDLLRQFNEMLPSELYTLNYEGVKTQEIVVLELVACIEGDVVLLFPQSSPWLQTPWMVTRRFRCTIII